MSLPVYLHSGMTNAPQISPANGTINALLNAALVNGFNTQSVSSATASGGVVTFNFPSAPGFNALDTVTIAGASNATVNGQFRVQSAASNQVLVSIPGVPDGAVAGTITMKFSPLGWTRPYSGTNLGAYQQGGTAAHKRFVRIYDGTVPTSGRFYSRGYEAMTAVSSGTGPFPTTTEVSGNGCEALAPYWAAGNRPWIVVGTPRAFYLLLGYDNDYSGTAPPEFKAGGYDVGLFYFGEYARVQKVGDTYAYGIPSNYYFPNATLYGSRAYTGAAGSRPQVSMYGYGAGVVNAGCLYPDPASGGITFGDAPAIFDNFGGSLCLRGFLPGALIAANAPMASVAPPVGSPGYCFENITGVTGRVMMVCGHGRTGGEFGLLLDEDWGDV